MKISYSGATLLNTDAVCHVTWASHLLSQNLIVLICEIRVMGEDQLGNRGLPWALGSH